MHLSPDSVRRLARIAVKHGAVRAFVFGSFARGDAGPGSDLDVLVELEPGRSLLDLARLEDELEDSLGLDVDVVTAKSLYPEVLERVIAERKAVL